MKSKVSVLLIGVLVLGMLLPEDGFADFNNLPEGFEDQAVVGGIPAPTSIAWLPPGGSDNGDMLVTSRGGVLFRVNESAEPILNLSGEICSGGEMGLLGLAVHPDFATGERFVYLYYTDRKGNGNCDKPSSRANRVSRFPMDAGGVLGAEEVLINNIPARGGNHNGGDLQFGNDGLLYISVGDSGQDLITGKTQDDNTNARYRSLLNGKILRITPDGDVPPGNPFTGNGTVSCADTGRSPLSGSSVDAEKKSRKAKKRKKRKLKKKRKQLRRAPACQEIFATGLRNPYRIAFDPDDPQRFFINDVGGHAWEEIDEGLAGVDYGWNVREGPCKTGTTNKCGADNRFVEPIFAYRHSTGCRTITGGAFVPDDSGWPAEYLDSYLYADFICDRLFELRDVTSGLTQRDFGLGSGATHLAFGPDKALYYTTFEGGGQVRKIVYIP